ncbi:hypothetical protein PAT3040_03221 [Paenibacillus agaridevorans]|uniref:Uncharacterized protein n=1 Tax=Paenibacillus agaridevorans TaxID=171404 RepID=A0A2R5EXT9_9BACL|nr:hypothetical protein PAT3040_03221 [Paenibacillus agaridevorans]
MKKTKHETNRKQQTGQPGRLRLMNYELDKHANNGQELGGDASTNANSLQSYPAN